MATVTKRALINTRLVLRDGFWKRKVIHVKHHVDDLIRSYDAAQQELEYAEKTLRENPSDMTSERFGQAVVKLLQVVFGPSSEEILEWYEGRYIEITADIYPFIQDEIVPKLQSAYKDKFSSRRAARK